MIDLLPPPLVVQVDATPAAWTSYVTPAATWRVADLPVVMAPAGPAPPGLDAEAFAAGLVVAARTWSLPACGGATFSIVTARPSAGPLDADGRNDVVVHTTDWPLPLTPGATGHTVIFVSGDRIVEADVHLNARDFAFVLGKAAPKVDLRSILTHELGHVLGIGHSDVTRATMHAGLPAGIAARSLEDDDVAAVCALYAASGPKPACVCPTGYACVGFACETPGEPGTLGAACTASTDVRRCEGAGDDARCLLTSSGERCATLCGETGVCGTGLACVKDEDGFGYCVPDGARIVGADAGVDAGKDAAADAGAGTSPPPSEGCSCATVRREAAPPTGLWLALALLVSRRARAAR